MLDFATDEWLQSYKDAINANPDLESAAKGWERDITLVVEAEPDRGHPIDHWGWFNIEQGKCIEAKEVTPDEGDLAEFVIRAPYSTWKDVIQGRLDPIRGMLQGKLKVKGDLKALTEEVAAAQALVNIAASIPTRFPDESP